MACQRHRSQGELRTHRRGAIRRDRHLDRDLIHGDVVAVLKPFTINWAGKTGTTHGSPYSYDTRVPVLFHSTAFKPGRYPAEFYITDFVPTLSAALHMTEPPSSIGKPFVKALAAP